MQAAILSRVKSRRLDPLLVMDVTPLSIGIELPGGAMAPFIERNSSIPCRKAGIVSTEADDQSEVVLQVFQGEKARANDNLFLGKFTLRGIRPAPRGVPQIEVTFDIDADGIFHASAKDEATGNRERMIFST